MIEIVDVNQLPDKPFNNNHRLIAVDQANEVCKVNMSNNLPVAGWDTNFTPEGNLVKYLNTSVINKMFKASKVGPTGGPSVLKGEISFGFGTNGVLQLNEYATMLIDINIGNEIYYFVGMCFYLGTLDELGTPFLVQLRGYLNKTEIHFWLPETINLSNADVFFSTTILRQA